MKLAMRLPEKGRAATPTPIRARKRAPRSSTSPAAPPTRWSRQRKGRSDALGARRRCRLRRAARRGDAVGPQRLAHGRASGSRRPQPAGTRAAAAGHRAADAASSRPRSRRRHAAPLRPTRRPRRSSPRRRTSPRCRPPIPTPRRPWCSTPSALPAPALPPPAPAGEAASRPRPRRPARPATSPAASAASAARAATATQQLRSRDHDHPGHDDPGGARDRDQHRRARLCPRGRQPGRAQLRRARASWCRAARG